MIYCYSPHCTAIIFALIFFSACKPRLQKPVERIHIVTAKNNKIIAINGQAIIKTPEKPLNADGLQSQNVKQLYAKVKRMYKEEIKAKKRSDKHSEIYAVPRSKMPVSITLAIDSMQKTIFLKGRNNFARFLNMRYVFGTKDSLHLLAAKRWIYPRRNVITVSDKGINISRLVPPKEGSVNLTMSPGIQLFNLKRDTGRYSSGGIIGLQMGVDYHYRENRFISFNVGAATDVIALPIDYFGSGYIERNSAVYMSVRDNIEKDRFGIGYGLSLSRLYWTAIPRGDSLLPERKTRTTGLGLSFSANYKIKQNLRAGIIYQPNLISINASAPSGFQHFMAIQLTLNFRGKK